jgi:hypothetical protein
MTLGQRLTIETVQDRIEIESLFNRFADALDRKCFDELASLFVEDATSTWLGEFEQSSRDDLIAFIRPFIESVGATHHILGNFYAEVDGEVATAAVRVRAYHAGIGERDGLFEETLGAFEGRLRRTSQGWRFTHFAEHAYVMLGTQDVFGPQDVA